jgi:repressor LexA
MHMPRTSNKAQLIMDYVNQFIEENGFSPSVREIGAAVGLRSTSTVHAHLNHLEEKGLIRRDSTKPRALEVLDGTQARGRSVPLVGRVTAGQPILAIENIEEYLSLPQSVLGQGEMFSLRVEGESMIDAGIMDGDIVVLRQQDTAENGDIVVAMTPEDEATLKRIYYEKDRVRLQPENATMAPIYVDSVTVLGKLVALIRQFRCPSHSKPVQSCDSVDK